MSKEEIINKLQELFSRHDPLPEEAHVLYLMVEVRKIIDKDRSATRFPLLKFYADWMVHSQKDKITTEIEQMSEEMYAFAVTEINAPRPGMSGQSSHVLDFAYMEALSKEMTLFLTEAGVRSDMATDKRKWIDFASLLVKILENQPINSPSANVKTIIFEPANPRCTILTIVFKQPIKGYPSYTLKNAY